jgi:enoyl-CoA hydratase/carnithine racemase
MASGQADLQRHVLANGVVVGVSGGTHDAVVEDFDVLLTRAVDPPRPWVTGSLDEVESAVRSSPAAAFALVQVLRATEHLPVPAAIPVESIAYSMLQHGEVFQRWLGARPAPVPRVPTAEPVVLERTDGRLDIVLSRPEVHNALDATMRDALVDAFELVAADPSIVEVHLRGAGPSFCSGGDLDEFGTATDAGTAHLVRVARSVGRVVAEHADRVIAHLHGACIGAGIEISAFAGRVVAAPDTSICLPEVQMGLIPGAGGTISIPRRIGRHRTAYLALTGTRLDAGAAHRWGLVDEVHAASDPRESDYRDEHER